MAKLQFSAQCWDLQNPPVRNLGDLFRICSIQAKLRGFHLRKWLTRKLIVHWHAILDFPSIFLQNTVPKALQSPGEATGQLLLPPSQKYSSLIYKTSLILPMENKENTVTRRNSPQTALFSHHRNWRFLLFTTSSWITEEHSATAGRNPKM